MLTNQSASSFTDAELECLCAEALSNLQSVDVELPEPFGTPHVIELWGEMQCAIKPFVQAMAIRIYNDKLARLDKVLNIYGSFMESVYAPYAEDEPRTLVEYVRIAKHFYPATLLMYACSVTALRCFKHRFAMDLLTSPVGQTEAGHKFSLYPIAMGDTKHLPEVLKKTLFRSLINILPPESDVWGLVEATDTLYAIALIGHYWRSRLRKEIEAPNLWLPLEGLPEYRTAEEVEDALCYSPIDAGILDLNSIVRGTRERKTFYQMSDILVKRIRLQKNRQQARSESAITCRLNHNKKFKRPT